MVHNPTLGILNWCPYCGRPLAEGWPTCPFCGYRLGEDLGVMTAPRPSHKDDVYRQGQWQPPALPMRHLGLPVSPWDGRVHILVSSDGKWRWDGHRWIPNWFQPAVPASPATVPFHQRVAHEAKAAAGAKAGITTASWVVGAMFLVIVLIVFFGVLLPRLGGIGPGGGSAATWYLHFNCGGDPTCISTPGNGSNTGIFQDFSSSGDNQGACEGGRIPFDNLGEAKTSWCSTSSNPADTGP